MEIRRWRLKAIRQAATISRLQTALHDADARCNELRARLESRRHESLDHDLLRRILPIRAAQPPVTGHDLEAAAVRHARHYECCDVYREAVCSGDAEEITRIDIDGVRWWVPANAADSSRLERMQRQGFPYRTILQTREVAIGGVMLDIGANIGRTSIPRVMLGDVRAVYAAEPEPLNYACLVHNTLDHHLRGFVLPDRVAIGATRGTVRMRRSRYPGGHHVLRETNVAESIEVEMWPLDEWIAHLGVDAGAVTFVKVDTQGCEVGVLSGAASLLARPHVSWLMEVDPKLLQRAGTSAAALLEVLQRHFSHFIDIGAPDGGRRVRPTSQIAESLGYLGERQTKTDLLMVHA